QAPQWGRVDRPSLGAGFAPRKYRLCREAPPEIRPATGRDSSPVSPSPEHSSREWARRKIAECAVEGAGLGRTVVPVGPFRACLDPSTDMIFLNYVVPVWALGSSEEAQEQLARLRTVFHEHGRRLRFEFIDGIWPSLVDELERF